MNNGHTNITVTYLIVVCFLSLGQLCEHVEHETPPRGGGEGSDTIAVKCWTILCVYRLVHFSLPYTSSTCISRLCLNRWTKHSLTIIMINNNLENVLLLTVHCVFHCAPVVYIRTISNYISRVDPVTPYGVRACIGIS